MKLVVDANVLFAAIITDGMTRQLLCGRHELYTPEFMLTEFEKYLSFISKRTDIDESSLQNLFKILLLASRMHVVASEEIVPFISSAKDICPDPDDIQYLALALKLGCGLWSNDKKLKEQDVVKVYSTEEISRL